MSTERVSVVQLRELVHLKISDIESLIDNVHACDERDVSDFCRVGVSSTNTVLRPFEKEWKGTDEEWRKRRICSKDAKLIAKGITSTTAYMANLLYEYDVILGKAVENPSDPGLLWMDYEEKADYFLATTEEPFLLVYERFLEVLFLSFDDARQHITSKPFNFKYGISEATKLRFAAIADSLTTLSGEMPASQFNHTAATSTQSLLVLSYVSERVSTEGRGSAQVRNTCQENQEAVNYVKKRREQGATSEDIAAELHEAGASFGVIGCLIKSTCKDVEAARAHGKYLLRKKNKH